MMPARGLAVYSGVEVVRPVARGSLLNQQFLLYQVQRVDHRRRVHEQVQQHRQRCAHVAIIDVDGRTEQRQRQRRQHACRG